jgi:hypothetical protein
VEGYLQHSWDATQSVTAVPLLARCGEASRLLSDTCNAVDAVIAESVDDSTAAPPQVGRCASAFSDVGKPRADGQSRHGEELRLDGEETQAYDSGRE